MSFVVGVGGPIGAGKSVVADELAAIYVGARRSFGGVVRRRAKAARQPLDRGSLQEFGDQIIATDGWNNFGREVLGGMTDRVVVVDGIRHTGAIDAFIAIVGKPHFRLVFVDAPREERLARLIARDGITAAEFDAAELHPNERELPLVRERANVLVDNTKSRPESPELLARMIVTQLEDTGFTPT